MSKRVRSGRSQVPLWMDWMGAAAAPTDMWLQLAQRESAVLRERLDAMPSPSPIYVAGLARSGSTALLQALACCPVCASHRYRDFPFLSTPYWWNAFLDRAAGRRGGRRPKERLHGDGIAITADSPEAMEEPVWMAFFPKLHDAGRSQVLDANTQHEAFERFYADHLRKVILVRGGTHYLAKGNYNVTRLEYLLRMFPDARFIVPVRSPDAHIASLERQHRRFCSLQRADARVLRYMQRLGHFEFGLDRRPIHVGPSSQAPQIIDDWMAGRDLEGLARLWSDVYGYLAIRLAESKALREATLVVRHEDLVANPPAVLARVFRHCRLSLRYPELMRLADGIGEASSSQRLEGRALARIRPLVEGVAHAYRYELPGESAGVEAKWYEPADGAAEGRA